MTGARDLVHRRNLEAGSNRDQRTVRFGGAGIIHNNAVRRSRRSNGHVLDGGNIPIHVFGDIGNLRREGREEG